MAAASDFKAKLLITHPVFNPIFILLWYAFYAWDDKICIHIYQPLDVDQTSSSLRFYLTASDRNQIPRKDMVRSLHHALHLVPAP